MLFYCALGTTLIKAQRSLRSEALVPSTTCGGTAA